MPISSRAWSAAQPARARRLPAECSRSPVTAACSRITSSVDRGVASQSPRRPRMPIGHTVPASAAAVTSGLSVPVTCGGIRRDDLDETRRRTWRQRRFTETDRGVSKHATDDLGLPVLPLGAVGLIRYDRSHQLGAGDTARFAEGSRRRARRLNNSPITSAQHPATLPGGKLGGPLHWFGTVFTRAARPGRMKLLGLGPELWSGSYR